MYPATLIIKICHPEVILDGVLKTNILYVYRKLIYLLRKCVNSP